MKKTNKILLPLLFILPYLFLQTGNVSSENFNHVGEIDKISTRDVRIKKEQISVEINNASDLIDFIDRCQIDSYSEDKVINLNCDIDLKGREIKPIAIFKGTLNGNDHTIKNFTIDKKYSGNEISFIRKLSTGGVINNLRLKYDLETTNDNTVIGGIVGTNEGTIKSCTYEGKLKGSHYVGGIAGVNKKDAVIDSCNNYGSVIGEIIVGGITSRNDGTITNSINYGIINDTRFSSTTEITVSNIGGVVGFNKGKIERSTNKNSVGIKQVGNFIGGIAGSSIGQILSCSNSGTIRGNLYVGGIIGYYAEFIIKENNDPYNELIEIIKGILSGIDGSNPDLKPGEETVEKVSVQYCYNNGQIYGENSVGGICGYASNDNTKLANKNLFTVELSCNEGEISGTTANVGGICGNHVKGKIQDSFNMGPILSNHANYVGGIAGSSTDTISYCFSLNDIHGNNYVGGIGGLSTYINDCYSLSNISSKESFIGSIAGYIEEINNKVKNNYYVNENINGIDNVDYKDKAQRVSRDVIASKDNLNVNLDSDHYSVSTTDKKFPTLKLIKNASNLNEIKENIISKMEEATEFGCYVSFIDENDEVIKRVFVKYEDDLDLSSIPLAPSKEGFFASWEDFDSHKITEDIYVKVIYKETIRSIASNKGPHPDVIVEGNFYTTTRIKLTKKDKNMLPEDSIYTYLGTYNIEIADDENRIDTDEIKVKMRLPKDIEAPSIATYKNGKIVFLDSYVDHSYICFNLKNLDEFILLEQKFTNWNNPNFQALVISLSVGIPLLLGGGTFLTVHLVKKKKHRAN